MATTLRAIFLAPASVCRLWVSRLVWITTPEPLKPMPAQVLNLTLLISVYLSVMNSLFYFAFLQRILPPLRLKQVLPKLRARAQKLALVTRGYHLLLLT